MKFLHSAKSSGLSSLYFQDYQAEVESTTRQHEQSRMVNWIVDSVVQSITPQQVLYKLLYNLFFLYKKQLDRLQMELGATWNGH